MFRGTGPIPTSGLPTATQALPRVKARGMPNAPHPSRSFGYAQDKQRRGRKRAEIVNE